MGHWAFKMVSSIMDAGRGGGGGGSEVAEEGGE